MEKTETLIRINWLVSVVATALFYFAATAFMNGHLIFGSAFVAVVLVVLALPTPKWGYLTVWKSVKVDVTDE